jgi:hypothetical protein
MKSNLIFNSMLAGLSTLAVDIASANNLRAATEDVSNVHHKKVKSIDSSEKDSSKIKFSTNSESTTERKIHRSNLEELANYPESKIGTKNNKVVPFKYNLCDAHDEILTDYKVLASLVNNASYKLAGKTSRPDGSFIGYRTSIKEHLLPKVLSTYTEEPEPYDILKEVNTAKLEDGRPRDIKYHIRSRKDHDCAVRVKVTNLGNKNTRKKSILQKVEMTLTDGRTPEPIRFTTELLKDRNNFKLL